MTTKTYNYYVKNFTEWLKVLGYSETSVYGMPRILKEFFSWLEQLHITQLESLTAEHIEQFINYNKTRANKRREGSIGAGHINRYIDVLRRFNEYLKKASHIEIPINIIRLEDDVIKERPILSREEIHLLYAATDENPMGIRDRAMLSIYYGCGLRKTEGIQLDLSDVLLERRMLYIRKSKNTYPRYTPITTGNLKYIEQYIYNARPLLIADQSSEQALFVSERGSRIHQGSMYLRLKALQQKAKLTKEIGVHTLRHSIATHLLQSGMELENIALFLGHRCLDSTQVYTHIIIEQ